MSTPTKKKWRDPLIEDTKKKDGSIDRQDLTNMQVSKGEQSREHSSRLQTGAKQSVDERYKGNASGSSPGLRKVHCLLFLSDRQKRQCEAVNPNGNVSSSS